MTVTAADVMTSPVIAVTPETTIAEIATLLADHGISAVPVCNPDRSLAGIVPENDVLRPFCESDRARHEWWLAS